jgi:hypothetical protein
MTKMLLFASVLLSCSVFVFAQDDTKREEVLITRTGWGEVTLGATLKNVEKVLGKPERFSPVDDVAFADYPQKGLQISYFTKSRTVNAIFFYNNQANKKDYKSFAGKTDKGVNWNSSADEVLTVYGKPKDDFKDENSESWRRIVYDGMDFRFENKKLVRISVFLESDKK